MSAPYLLALLVEKHGGKLQQGECYHAIGMEQQKANALAGEILNRHYQLRALVKSKDGTWEVIFR